MSDNMDNVYPLPGVELEPYHPAPTPVPMPPPPDVSISIVDVRVVKSRTELRGWVAECRGGVELRGKRLAVHSTRLHLYWGRASRTWHRGFARITVGWVRWVVDLDRLHIRRELAGAGYLDSDRKQKAYEDAHRALMWSRGWRSGASLFGALAAFLCGWWAYAEHPWLTVGVLAVAGPPILGLLGSGRGTIVTPVYLPAPRTLDPTLIMTAFEESGIVSAKTGPARVVGLPVRRDAGWLAQIELPVGVTFEHVSARRIQLAQALDVNRDCLTLDPLSTRSEKLIALYVADEHPMDRQVAEWSLSTASSWSLWDPFPVAWDLTGVPIAVYLLFLHTLIGASPQRGKTSVAREFALAALLDPRVDVIIVDFKGGVDWLPYRDLALRFLHGPRSVPAFRDLITWLHAEYERRMVVISTVGLKKAPEGRVNPLLAEDPDLGMRPIVVIVDEMQWATQDVTHGKVIVRDWAALAKLCPAAGLSFVATTQKPDTKSVPTELRDIFLQRIALSVPTRHASEAVLGTEAYSEGLNAAALGGIPGYGIMWAQPSDESDGFRGKVRFPNMTPAAADVVLARAARIREHRPRPVEDAPADSGPGVRPDVIVMALASWPRPQMYAHSDVLAERMGWDVVELRRAMLELGVDHPSVRMDRDDGRNPVQRGYRLADVEAVTR